VVKIKVEFEFNTDEEQAQCDIVLSSHKMYLAICQVEESMREASEHNEEVEGCEETCRLIEEWMDMLRETGVLDL